MGVTVREAMRIGGLFRCRVVAGHGGLDKKIDTIAVMEVPDIIQWLQRNVLLLTQLSQSENDANSLV